MLESLAEIVPLEVSRLTARELGPPQYKPTRRVFLKALILSTAGAMLYSIQRRAFGVGTDSDYAIYSSCSGLKNNFASDHDCNGCEYGRIYGGCTSTGFHKHIHPTYDLRPNECDTETQSNLYDGWKWKPSNCCYIGGGVYRRDREWRCHDGRISGNLSICRWVTLSGTQCAV